MDNKLYTVEEVIKFIENKEVLVLAGDEKVLSKLPQGYWIGGTIPYFMDVEQAEFSQEKIFVNRITVYDDNYSMKFYDENNIHRIVSDSFDNGYTLLIMPPFGKVYQRYSLETENMLDLYNNPIIGWIAGNDLNSQDVPKTFYGLFNLAFEDKAVALHIKLPKNKFAEISIVNIFEQDKSKDTIQFLEDSFEIKNCLINGVETNFVDYLFSNNIDYKLPLVSDYTGAAINVSIKDVDEENKTVSFYAPVFKSRIYQFPKDIENYVEAFESNLITASVNNEFSCNCILNYLYGELEGKKIKNVKGPITFGEIAYNLLNQTLTSLVIHDV